MDALRAEFEALVRPAGLPPPGEPLPRVAIDQVCILSHAQALLSSPHAALSGSRLSTACACPEGILLTTAVCSNQM
jgi:hypothetical protein